MRGGGASGTGWLAIRRAVSAAALILVLVGAADAQQTGFFVPKSLCTEIKQPSTDHVVCWDPTAKVLKYWNGTAYIAAPAGGSITVNAGAGTGLTIVGSPVSLGGTVTLGTTSDALRYGSLSLNTAPFPSVRLTIDEVAGTVHHTAVMQQIEVLSGVNTIGAQNATLNVIARAFNTSLGGAGGGANAQANALLAEALQHGTGDVVGLFSRATQAGPADAGGFTYTAFGAFLYAEANTTAGNAALGLQMTVVNNTGADDPYVFGVTFPRFIGADLDYSSAGNIGGPAVYIRAGSQPWRTGISFTPGAVQTNLIEAVNVTVTNAGVGSFVSLNAQASVNVTNSGGNFTVVGSDSGIQFGFGTNIFRMASDGRLKLFSQSAVVDVADVLNALTGFRIAGAATSGNVLRGNGTNFVSAQLAASDLSNGTTGSGAVVLATSPAFVTTITGDMSNATHSNRLVFVTSTANADTRLAARPNGTGTAAYLNLYNTSDTNNAAIGRISMTATSMEVNSTGNGTFSFLPLTLRTNNAVRMTISTAGGVGLTAFTFANIGTVLTTDGEFGYCSDCAAGALGVPANCAGAGTGAFAMQLNGTARCWN